MNSLSIALVVGALTALCGMAGLLLQKWLADHHTAERSRDMIGAIVGLISLLLALVLGTLIGSLIASTRRRSRKWTPSPLGLCSSTSRSPNSVPRQRLREPG